MTPLFLCVFIVSFNKLTRDFAFTPPPLKKNDTTLVLMTNVPTLIIEVSGCFNETKV